MTTLPDSDRLLEGIPTDPAGIARTTQGLLVHEFMAESYGVTDANERAEELEIRSVTGMIRALGERNDQLPLVTERAPADRLIGNCRQFSVLAVALLQRAQVPARARVGFADYLDDPWTDHWVVERWDGGHWVRMDVQLDEVFSQALEYDFDPLRLPDGEFLTGAEAWQRCRSGQDDPARFGLQDMHGSWFILGNLIRDVAAVTKVEVAPWDAWGAMPGPDDAIDEHLAAAADTWARIVLEDDLERLLALSREPGVAVTPTVFSARFQRPVEISVAAPAG